MTCLSNEPALLVYGPTGTNDTVQVSTGAAHRRQRYGGVRVDVQGDEEWVVGGWCELGRCGVTASR